MKTEIMKFIKSNYKNLTASETNELAKAICKLLPKAAVKLSEIKAGARFKYKGYEFTKLVDEEKSCYCLLNDSVFETEFGDTNDWAKSPIRKCLNAFDEQGDSRTLKGINEADLVGVSLNYLSYKNPNGRTKDRITLLSWEEWYAYFYAFGFDIAGFASWLRSGNDSHANYAYSVYSGGGYNNYNVSDLRAVRPALHFRKDLEVEE